MPGLRKKLSTLLKAPLQQFRRSQLPSPAPPPRDNEQKPEGTAAAAATFAVTLAETASAETATVSMIVSSVTMLAKAMTAIVMPFAGAATAVTSPLRPTDSGSIEAIPPLAKAAAASLIGVPTSAGFLTSASNQTVCCASTPSLAALPPASIPLRSLWSTALDKLPCKKRTAFGSTFRHRPR